MEKCMMIMKPKEKLSLKIKKKLIPHQRVFIKKPLVMQNRLDIVKILKDMII